MKNTLSTLILSLGVCNSALAQEVDCNPTGKEIVLPVRAHYEGADLVNSNTAYAVLGETRLFTKVAITFHCIGVPLVIVIPTLFQIGIAKI